MCPLRAFAGAIDGTHVRVKVPHTDVPRYRGRKGYSTQNVLAACTFDLKFTYIWTGWEGTTSDSRIIKNALVREDKLKIPNGDLSVAKMALKMITRRLSGKLLPIFTPASMLQSHATSFGFKEVWEEEKSQMVGNVFTSVASNYDLMNDLMSAGLHRLWKERLVSELNPFPGMKHLDVAGGTGDVAFRILETINSGRCSTQNMLEDNLQEKTEIYICDINLNMLNVGKTRAQERGLGEDGSLIWVEGDAEALNFDDDSVDSYTIAFGIRNVTHIEKALTEAYRVLKRGGRFLCIELSHVENPVFKQLYDYYSFSVIPAIGERVAGDRDSYQYLVESIRRFPSQEKFASLIAGAGFQKIEYENLVGGVVAIHSGLKF